jgi:hypothetical protein
MKDCTGFWFGMGAGLTAGVMIGMLAISSRRSMKTQVGKRIQQMGVAVDHTMDHLISNLR